MLSASAHFQSAAVGLPNMAVEELQELLGLSVTSWLFHTQVL